MLNYQLLGTYSGYCDCPFWQILSCLFQFIDSDLVCIQILVEHCFVTYFFIVSFDVQYLFFLSKLCHYQLTVQLLFLQFYYYYPIIFIFLFVIYYFAICHPISALLYCVFNKYHSLPYLTSHFPCYHVISYTYLLHYLSLCYVCTVQWISVLFIFNFRQSQVKMQNKYLNL